jgi:hypothetical protein
MIWVECGSTDRPSFADGAADGAGGDFAPGLQQTLPVAGEFRVMAGEL